VYPSRYRKPRLAGTLISANATKLDRKSGVAQWRQKSATLPGVLDGTDRATGEPKWNGTVVDLVSHVFREMWDFTALSFSH
jgi:catalase (peroxidase I)